MQLLNEQQFDKIEQRKQNRGVVKYESTFHDLYGEFYNINAEIETLLLTEMRNDPSFLQKRDVIMIGVSFVLR